MITSIALLAALWLTFQHKPRWYQPVVLDARSSQAAKADAVTTADHVSDRMVEGRLFEITLTEDSVNGWLAALPHAWPDAQRALPPELSAPAVSFDPQELRIGALAAVDGWQTIVSVALAIQLTEDGREVSVALAGAGAGSLPFPRALLRRALEPLISDLHADHPGRHDGSDVLTGAMREIRSADDLFDGIRIPNRFVWLNGDRPFRIESITLGEGQVRLRIEPL
jgi:hypothetical protein